MRTYTLGTGHRASFDFSRILSKYGIQVIFDVRRNPESPEPHFRRDGLRELCEQQAVSYVYIGNELGGPHDRDYRAWVATEAVRRWLDIIRSKSEKRVCCVLCSELTPRHCHRRVIGDLLARQEIEVVHIIDDSSTWHPEPGDPSLLDRPVRPAAGRFGPGRGRGRPAPGRGRGRAPERGRRRQPPRARGGKQR